MLGSMVSWELVRAQAEQRQALITLRVQLAGWDGLMQGLRKAGQAAADSRYHSQKRLIAEQAFVSQCGKVNDVLEVGLSSKNVAVFLTNFKDRHVADLKKTMQLIDKLDLLKTLQSDERVKNCRIHCAAALALRAEFVNETSTPRQSLKPRKMQSSPWQIANSHANRIPKRQSQIEDGVLNSFTNTNLTDAFKDELFDEYNTVPRAVCCW